MGRQQKPPIEEIIAAYEATGSVWKAGELLGRRGQTVYRWLKQAGYQLKGGNFTEAEKDQIRNAYAEGKKRGEIKLDELAEKMGRRKTSICRMASHMGLTSYHRGLIGEIADNLHAARDSHFKEHGHPRGMAGKTHSDENKKKFSKMSKDRMASMTEEQFSDRGLKAQKTRVKNGTQQRRNKGSWKAGYREIGGERKYYRSRWEANYARVLEYLKQNSKINDWKHEPRTFWFEKIKRGTRSYLPDFKVVNNDGTHEWHEVKGWMDKRSKTKIKRFHKYYPEERLIVIGGKDYKQIEEFFSPVIDGWEI